MAKSDRLFTVMKSFSEIDLNPKEVDSIKMGYIFEDLIRRFSENAEAGDHYTGRDIVKLLCKPDLRGRMRRPNAAGACGESFRPGLRYWWYAVNKPEFYPAYEP